MDQWDIESTKWYKSFIKKYLGLNLYDLLIYLDWPVKWFRVVLGLYEIFWAFRNAAPRRGDQSGMLRETRKWTPWGVFFLNSQERSIHLRKKIIMDPHISVLTAILNSIAYQSDENGVSVAEEVDFVPFNLSYLRVFRKRARKPEIHWEDAIKMHLMRCRRNSRTEASKLHLASPQKLFRTRKAIGCRLNDQSRPVYERPHSWESRLRVRFWSWPAEG